MSSVFSRKITMSTFSGCFTGDGTPLYQRTGRRQTNRSSICRKRDVQRTDAAADRRRQRTLDADQVRAKGLDGLVRQPVVELLEAFLARVDFHPRDLLLAAVRLRDRRVEHAHARAPDVGAGAVAFDERDDRIVGNDELSVLALDRRSILRDGREFGMSFLGHFPTSAFQRFTQNLWKSLWKSGRVYRVVMPQSGMF